MNETYEEQSKKQLIETMKRSLARGNEELLKDIFSTEFEQKYGLDITSELKLYAKELDIIQNVEELMQEDKMIDAFIGQENHLYYRELLKKKSPSGFSFWGFFFFDGILWYRKMYLAAIILEILYVLFLFPVFIYQIINFDGLGWMWYLFIWGLIFGFIAPRLVYMKYQKSKQKAKLYFENREKQIASMALDGGHLPLWLVLLLTFVFYFFRVYLVSVLFIMLLI